MDAGTADRLEADLIALWDARIEKAALAGDENEVLRLMLAFDNAYEELFPREAGQPK